VILQALENEVLVYDAWGDWAGPGALWAHLPLLPNGSFWY
jgi:hypothetical protein